uniref:Uncharacterized protein n=1 Tax=Arion vulgaris TaxID=1028688 RepID=A0A0B6ZZW2_9EUPU
MRSKLQKVIHFRVMIFLAMIEDELIYWQKVSFESGSYSFLVSVWSKCHT